MDIGNVSEQQVREYLQELDKFQRQIDFLQSDIRKHLEIYHYHPDDEINTTKLQSYIAYYERFLRPVFIEPKSEQKYFVEPSRRLTLGIDRQWKSYEFRQLFDGIDNLHKIYVLRSKLRRKSPDLRLRHGMTRSRVYRYGLLYYYLTPHEEIQVTSIQFASPGQINLEGLGDAVRELRELLHYVITFQFVKGFVDVYDHFKYERPIQRVEKRIKLKEVLEQEQSFERNRQLREIDEYRVFLKTMNEIADLAIELDKKGLANGDIVGDIAVRSISYLNRLGFEQEKVKLPNQSAE